jgi:hypothetical protein
MRSLPSQWGSRVGLGIEPGVDGRCALPTARAAGAVMPVSRLTPGVMRLRAVPRTDGALDFMWEFISAAAAPLFSCTPMQLYGRCMSEGRAGVFDHPVLAERYHCVVESGVAQSFEQVHRVQGLQELLRHQVIRHGHGVLVTLINLSAARRASSARRSSRVRAYMNATQST